MAKKPDVQPAVVVDADTAQPSTTDETLLPDVQPEILYVMMTRDADRYDEPHSAQVHPDEVANYYSGGWVEAK